MKRVLRLSLWAAAALYAAALFFVLFLWGLAVGRGRGWHSLNLAPLSQVVAVYLAGDSLVRSQFALNILLFAPLGFLLPLLFPRAAGKLWQTALFALAATVVAETVQYFIGRSADIDDVIANFLGGVAGYALFALARAILGKTAFWRALSNSEGRTKPLAAVAALLAFLLIFGFPFALDALDAQSPHGLFRFVSGSIPASASIQCDLGGIGAQKEPVYLERTGVAGETAERVLALFPAPEGAERSENRMDGAFGGMAIYVTARDGSYRLSAFGDGNFRLSVAGAYPKDAAGFGAWVEGVLPQLAPAGATLALTDVSEQRAEDAAGAEEGTPTAAVERTVTARADAKAEGEGIFVLGQIVFTYAPDAGQLWINGSVVLADPAGEAEIISAADALKAARGPWPFASFAYTQLEITCVELTACELRGRYVPCYLFSGTAKYDGEIVPFACVVDAIKR